MSGNAQTLRTMILRNYCWGRWLVVGCCVGYMRLKREGEISSIDSRMK